MASQSTSFLPVSRMLKSPSFPPPSSHLPSYLFFYCGSLLIYAVHSHTHKHTCTNYDRRCCCCCMQRQQGQVDGVSNHLDSHNKKEREGERDICPSPLCCAAKARIMFYSIKTPTDVILTNACVCLILLLITLFLLCEL